MMDLYKWRCIQVRGGEANEIIDEICAEQRYRLQVNGIPVAGMVASDEQLEELGVGFVVAEGLVGDVEGVEVQGDEIRVTATLRPSGDEVVGSSGGVSFLRPLPRVTSDLQVSIDDVYQMTAAIESDDWRRTGGLHCSVLFCDGELVAKACDVGRHNAVDKVIGRAVLDGLDRSRCVVGCTGRQPLGMVAKAAHAGVPIVISRAASTDRGIAAAEEAGITLICFSRGERFTVYTHPERVAGVME